MRIHILGHSDSGLDDSRNPAWPVRLRDALQPKVQEPVEVTASRLAPYGSRAVGYALRAAEEAAPEVVILSASAFTCTVGLVSVRVGERFGRRARRAYEAVEQRYSGLVAGAPAGAVPPDRLLRSIARNLIGTATLATVEEVGAVYAAILHGLAQGERLQVIVLGESFFGHQVQRANPGIVAEIQRLRAIVKPAVDAHRFAWLDLEAAFCSNGDREQHFLRDGVHNSAAGHHRVAELVADEIMRPDRNPGTVARTPLGCSLSLRRSKPSP